MPRWSFAGLGIVATHSPAEIVAPWAIKGRYHEQDPGSESRQSSMPDPGRVQRMD
jgi:hypothetical protein